MGLSRIPQQPASHSRAAVRPKAVKPAPQTAARAAHIETTLRGTVVVFGHMWSDYHDDGEEVRLALGARLIFLVVHEHGEAGPPKLPVGDGLQAPRVGAAALQLVVARRCRGRRQCRVVRRSRLLQRVGSGVRGQGARTPSLRVTLCGATW